MARAAACASSRSPAFLAPAPLPVAIASFSPPRLGYRFSTSSTIFCSAGCFAAARACSHICSRSGSGSTNCRAIRMYPRSARTWNFSPGADFVRSSSTGAASAVIHSPRCRVLRSCSCGSVPRAAPASVFKAFVPPTAASVSMSVPFASAGAFVRAAANSPAHPSRSGIRTAAVFSAVTAASSVAGAFTTSSISTGKRSSSTVAPNAARPACRTAGFAPFRLFSTSSTAGIRRRAITPSSTGLSVSSPFDSCDTTAAFTPSPGSSANAPSAACRRSASVCVATTPSSAVRQVSFPTRPTARIAASCTGLAPEFISPNSPGRRTVSRRSARAFTSSAARSAGNLATSSSSAASTVSPADSRSTVSASRWFALSGECSCSRSSASPSSAGALRIAPRVASSFRWAGTSACRTFVYNASAAARSLLASRSAVRMHPSATAFRTSPVVVPSAAASAAEAFALGMCPSATAAALATWASACDRCFVSSSTAPASRRTPSEFNTPTSSWPSSLGAASRSAALASGPGIASRAMRAHEASCASVSSFATSGTQSGEPYTARCLQVIAFSAGAASERSTANRLFSFSV